MSEHRYAARYCEENVWWLAQEPRFVAQEREVVWITNASRTVAMAAQRAGQPGALMVWDYHVVLAVRGAGGVEVWDLDSRLPLPVAGARWLAESFGVPVPARFVPRFRVVPAAEYVADFASDRRHMRDARGRWLAPPPSWPAIGQGHTLEVLVDLRGGPGIVLDRAALAARWA